MSKVNLRYGVSTSLVTRLVAAGAMLFLADAAQAQLGARVADPPVLEEREGTAPSTPHEQLLELNVEYVEGSLFNPATGSMDRVWLRSYTGPGISNERYIAPAIHASPGETLRVNLHNRLPADPTCAKGDHGDVNVPHCFNGTNLHTHGLWVNPSGNGDNVLLSINPADKFEYEFPIPSEHPAGTFWYHTHRHGSTALQVSSGMAGALIIHGDRLPTATRPGDLDTLLKGAPDHVFVLQQIQYYCPDAEGGIKRNDNNTYRCDPGDVGVIENYEPFRSASGWSGSGRYTSINGLILPDVEARQGEVARWRFIHGGVRDTIGIQFRKARKNPLRPGHKLSAARMERFVDQNCDGDALPFHLAAADGITLPAAQRKEVATLQPGYRADALVVFPEAGNYCVLDAESLASESVGGVPSNTRLLAMVRVEADPASGVADVGGYLTEKLVAAAERSMPADVRAAVVADLRDGLKLGRFVPHPTITDAEVAGSEIQELLFAIDSGDTSGYQVGGRGYAPRVYDPGRLDRQLTLGTAQEWRLESEAGGHPFHIHVNPFQIVEVIDGRGNDVSGPESSSQFAGLKGAWKDTVWVPRGYAIRVRSRYERFIGEFVLHCHILDHEDKGMMQNVAIVLPGGTPASVNASAAGHEGH
jgi:L-ascorbate oxidase